MNKIVESILAEFSKDNGIEGMSEDDRFEYLISYLAIRRHFSRALDLKEVVVGDGGDTGVDAIAIIVNGALITDVDQVEEMLTQNGYLEATFIFIQAERSANFEAAKIGTIRAGVRDFFRDKPELTQNENVQDAFEIKNAIFERASKFRDRPACHIYYVTTGRWEEPKDLVAGIADTKDNLRATDMFKEVAFIPYGADDIHRLHTATKNAISRTFVFSEHLQLPTIKGVNLSFLGYLPAKDYVKMDYNEVNGKIRDTIQSPTKERFVLMNNGITIIAREFKQSGKTFTIENFQIVNGCQTSNVLFDHRAILEKDDTIHVPLRLIWTNDDNVIDSVISGTNQQTELTPEQIYARTEFAKKLEKEFAAYPESYRLYYERRDGQYDRLPVERGRIVPPQLLIKVFASMFLEEPHIAAKNYKTLRDRIGKDFLLESDKLDPYFVSALAAYRLEIQLRTKTFRIYKSARYHLLLAMRLLLDPGPISKMNSHDMTKRCAPMIETLADDAKCQALIKKAMGVIDKACAGDLSRDTVRTITTTEAIIKALKKFKT